MLVAGSLRCGAGSLSVYSMGMGGVGLDRGYMVSMGGVGDSVDNYKSSGGWHEIIPVSENLSYLVWL